MFGGFCPGEMTGCATVVGRRVILDPSVGSGKRTRDPYQSDISTESVQESNNSSGLLKESLINVTRITNKVIKALLWTYVRSTDLF